MTGRRRREIVLSAPFLFDLDRKEHSMPNMSDNRRKKIQASQRKAKNALKRTAKAAKRAQRKAG